MQKTILIICGQIFFSLVANAKIFNNAYLSFEIPDSWRCSLEQTEWVCRSELSKEAKEAIIILTAKEVGPTDSYALYEQILNTPKKIQVRGSIQESKVSYPPKEFTTNGQKWLDGLHLGSEVPNYFTRYLAGIKENKIAILVTFSAHKDFYTKYSQDFFKAVQSLRITATDKIIAGIGQGQINSSGGILGVNTSAHLPMEPESAPSEEDGGGSTAKKIYLFLGILLAAMAAYFFIKKSQRK